MREPVVLSGRDLRGVIVPVVTPFDPAGAVDHASFESLLEQLLEAGVHGLVIAGTTGESPTLRWPEVEDLVSRARAVVRGQLPLLIGTGTDGTADSVERTQRAGRLGAEAATFCTEDALFLPALEAGAAGGILAAANLVPHAFVELYAAFRAGQPLAARAIAARLRPLVQALFAEPSPAPLKHALALGGRIASGTLRLPMVPPSRALGERLAELLRARAPGDVASVAGLDELAARFDRQAIPASEWNHRCHLLVGAWHVFRLGPDLALQRMRAGIRRLNQAHGTPETETRGYHETITRAYVELLAIFLGGFPAETPFEARAAALLVSPLAAPDVLLRFYNRQRLLSPAARAAWVEPDCAALGV
jgi:dihydrodipicolinate synthase/N-acetylneuraminate lyase